MLFEFSGAAHWPQRASQLVLYGTINSPWFPGFPHEARARSTCVSFRSSCSHFFRRCLRGDISFVARHGNFFFFAFRGGL